MNILEKFYTFLFSVISTGAGGFKYKVPDVTKTETFVFFGKNVTVTESYADGVVDISVKLS